MELTLADVLVLSVLVGYCTVIGVLTIIQTVLLLRMYKLAQTRWK